MVATVPVPLMEPTVITDVPRNADMVVHESFGPLAPILTFKDIDDAIALSNSTAYGLSSGIVTNNMEYALRFVKELKVGTVNINEVPGYRLKVHHLVASKIPALESRKALSKR
jgi:aldehyde dehydrogenase (NAD+)